jgi:hypothetical protein
MAMTEKWITNEKLRNGENSKELHVEVSFSNMSKECIPC